MSARWPVSVDQGGQDVAGTWKFVCPVCRPPCSLEWPPETTPDLTLQCARCRREYRRSKAIWRFLPDELLAGYATFLREYQHIRHGQGWGGRDAAYYLALPEVTPDDPQADIWCRRRKSYQVLRSKAIDPLAKRLGRPLRIVDLGSGNGWLAYRLTDAGHQVAAIDLSLDVTDGLGAHHWYTSELHAKGKSRLTSIQADFDCLPLSNQEVDVALFNASLHYSTACEVTLREALRVLAPEGVVVIMDSPVYHDADSGAQMVRERYAEFERRYGFRSDSLPAEQFLTWDRLDDLARDLNVRWQIYDVADGSRALAHRLRKRWRMVRGLRELAQMPVIVGTL